VQRILREEGLAFVQSVWRTDSRDLPEMDEADDEPQGSPVAREEPQFFAKPSSRPQPEPSIARLEPQLQPPSATPQSAPAASSPAHHAGGEREEHAKLRAILDELHECRRVLDAAMTAASAGGSVN
jgi:hypothetical protein